MAVSKKSKEVLRRELSTLRSKRVEIVAKISAVNDELKKNKDHKDELQAQLAFLDADITSMDADVTSVIIG